MCYDELSLEYISNSIELIRNEFDEFIYRKNLSEITNSLAIFWNPMGGIKFLINYLLIFINI